MAMGNNCYRVPRIVEPAPRAQLTEESARGRTLIAACGVSLSQPTPQLCTEGAMYPFLLVYIIFVISVVGLRAVLRFLHLRVHQLKVREKRNGENKGIGWLMSHWALNHV